MNKSKIINPCIRLIINKLVQTFNHYDQFSISLVLLCKRMYNPFTSHYVFTSQHVFVFIAGEAKPPGSDYLH